MHMEQDDYDYEYLCMIDCLLDDADVDAIWVWVESGEIAQEFIKQF